MTDYTTSTTTPPQSGQPQYSQAQTMPTKTAGLRIKHMFWGIFIAFLLGGGAAAWLAYHYDYVGSDAAREPVAAVNTAQPSNITPDPPANTTQVNALENRMDAINDDAEAASGNATKAEALLVAFAARRALDGGQPLGYISGQLQQRFGNSQPQAVATIITAGQTPVTIDKLRIELQSLDGALTTGNRNAGAWDRFTRELSELFVLRKDGTPSAAPSQRMQRALNFVDGGNMPAAITEVRAMPGAAAANGWLARARQYADARQALDVIERAAIQSGTAAPTPVAPAANQPPQTEPAPAN